MQVGTSMVTRSKHVVNFLLDHVGFFAVVTDLVALLVILAISREHRVVTVRRLVIETVMGGVVFYDTFCSRRIERPAHSGLPVSLVDVLMAVAARGRLHVSG